MDKDHPIQATWWHSIKEDPAVGRRYHQWLCQGQRMCVLCEKNAFAVKASPNGKLDNKEKTKTIIHELLHIPQSFGGGLLGHGQAKINRITEERLYSEYFKRKMSGKGNDAEED